ncbi:MAG: hypothetical protein M3Z16_07725, partial [Pseudomonadota bacterium]|nr:hypothetical protein [Pseudomonadota bacterium]
DAVRQLAVAADIAAQVAGSSHCIFGVMIESHLVAGAQKFVAGSDDPSRLAYGQSITDACLGWDDSLAALEALSEAVREGRRRAAAPKSVETGGADAGLKVRP